jgi:hypothetical protein
LNKIAIAATPKELSEKFAQHGMRAPGEGNMLAAHFPAISKYIPPKTTARDLHNF